MKLNLKFDWTAFLFIVVGIPSMFLGVPLILLFIAWGHPDTITLGTVLRAVSVFVTLAVVFAFFIGSIFND